MKRIFTLFFILSLVISGFAQFTGKPIYDIYTTRDGIPLGTIKVELFPAIAPQHVSNFDSLVNFAFYDTTAFHRVIPAFMIQGGDPNSRHGPRATWGYGEPGQPTVPAEFSPARHVRGILSAARDSDINSANSQFFICVATCSWLNNLYSVYGRVVSGMDIVDTIVSEPRDSVDNPLLKIEMFVTANGSNDSVPQVPVLDLPVNGAVFSTTNKLLKWDAVSDAILYHVEVSTDSTFATTYKSVDVGLNSYTVTGLSMGLRYYWRVNTNNGGHSSTWSDVWHFNTSAVGVESISMQTDPAVSVSPNPGNGRFRFFNLEKNDRIEIFDITGRSILKTSTVESDYTIDLSEKAKGIYFYQVSGTHKKTQQGKIILK